MEYCYGDQTEEDEMDKTVAHMAKMRSTYRILLRTWSKEATWDT
jgi:hypothetical protein